MICKRQSSDAAQGAVGLDHTQVVAAGENKNTKQHCIIW